MGPGDLAMVKITVYGGAGEIGGNKILVEDRGAKVFLDFGASFSDGTDYFSSGIEPRSVNGAGDYFQFGLLPELPGLYAEEVLQNTELRYTQPEIDAILLSHFHSDHVARINLVDEKIPIYCGETTKFIHEASSGSTGSPLDSHKIVSFRTGDKLRVGSLEIVPIHVDHSIPGAYGFIIYTSDGVIAYTGDYRFHGPLGNMTKDFADKAAEAQPLALLTEGTRVTDEDSRQGLTETDVVKETLGVLKKTKKLVFSSFRGNDIDRVNSFHRACEKAGRQLVVSMKTALLLEGLQKDKVLSVPKVGKDVSVYIRRKRSGTYDDSDYYEWERQFLSKGMDHSDIREHQKELFLHLDVWHFPEMIDIKPDKAGAYIHASSEAFDEEGEREEDVIKNWVRYLGFTYNQIHASGHAPMGGVRYMIDTVNAKKTIPIHTEYPKLFKAITSRALIPEKGKLIRIK